MHSFSTNLSIFNSQLGLVIVFEESNAILEKEMVI